MVLVAIGVVDGLFRCRSRVCMSALATSSICCSMSVNPRAGGRRLLRRGVNNVVAAGVDDDAGTVILLSLSFSFSSYLCSAGSSSDASESDGC